MHHSAGRFEESDGFFRPHNPASPSGQGRFVKPSATASRHTHRIFFFSFPLQTRTPYRPQQQQGNSVRLLAGSRKGETLFSLTETERRKEEKLPALALPTDGDESDSLPGRSGTLPHTFPLQNGILTPLALPVVSFSLDSNYFSQQKFAH